MDQQRGATAPEAKLVSTTEPSQSVGRVHKKVVKRYWVKAGDQSVVCTVSSKLRKVLIYPEADPSSRRRIVDEVVETRMVDPVAVGDEVRFIDAGDATGMITEVLPRRNKLSRQEAFGPERSWRSRKGALEQVIVSNIDQMMAVTSAARPKPSWRLMDRFLADAELLEIPALICLTKIDLCDLAQLREEVGCYERLGYPVLLTSALRREGLVPLEAQLRGLTTVLIGKSGVGKTTLLNALQPQLGLAVQEVSERIGKGKHTTSHLEMFELEVGGFVIDTPGMREFSPWEKDLNIAYLFREMRPHLGGCKFGAGCSHVHEPGCLIKEGVEAGEIDPRRYDSFVRMLRKITA